MTHSSEVVTGDLIHLMNADLKARFAANPQGSCFLRTFTLLFKNENRSKADKYFIAMLNELAAQGKIQRGESIKREELFYSHSYYYSSGATPDASALICDLFIKYENLKDIEAHPLYTIQGGDVPRYELLMPPSKCECGAVAVGKNCFHALWCPDRDYGRFT